MLPARVRITSLPHAAFYDAQAFNQKLCGDWVAKSGLQSGTFTGAGPGSIAASTDDCIGCTCTNGNFPSDSTACTTDAAQICGSCNTGYTLDPITAACEPPPCEPHCDACSDPTTCTTCSANYFLKDSDCVTSGNCGAGFFADTSADPDACTACGANCVTCSDATTCTACSANYFLKDSDCVKSYNCGAGFFADISAEPDACTACEADCAACSDATTCTACSSPNYFLNNGDCDPSVCTTPSPASTPGYTLSGQSGDLTRQIFDVSGLACAAGYGGTVVATACTTHNTAYSVGGCTPCGAGKYQSQNNIAEASCKVCEGGKFSNVSSASACKDCPAGRTLVDAATDASYHDDMLEDCTECRVGRYNFQPGLKIPCFGCETAKSAGATTCDGCNPGKYINGSGGECARCGPGRYSDTRDVDACTACPRGYFGLEVTATRLGCDTCPRGTFGDAMALLNATGCKSCVAGRYSDVDALQSDNDAVIPCKACSRGRWSDSTGVQESAGCINCNAGRFSGVDALTSESGCEACAAGKYSKSVGVSDSEQCRGCPSGFQQSETGQSFCVQCVPGQYQEKEAQPACQLCAINHFANETKMTKCHVCTIGTTAKTKGSTSCAACPAGKFGEAGPTCTKCAAGQFRDNDAAADAIAVSAALDACTACPEGFYQNTEGRASCLPCVPGKYQDDKNGTKCKLCAINHFANETEMTKCHVCAIGTTAKTNGSTSCAACPAGKFGEAGPTCTKCAAGQFRDNDAAAADAIAVSAALDASTACPEGFYQSAEGRASCLPCVPGKYQDNKNGIECKLCAINYFANETEMTKCHVCAIGTTAKTTGAASCAKCGAGRFGVGCALCPRGWHRPEDHPDLSRCVQCTIGQTSARQGAASCSSCDLGKFGSAPGVCTACSAAKYQDDKGQLACKTCRIGKVVNMQQTACETPGE